LHTEKWCLFFGRVVHHDYSSPAFSSIILLQIAEAKK
jgi:hypothetical protein